MKVALAGNPNCGKTTLFNGLTGSTAHVGNWPGVTVEKKSGVYKLYPNGDKKSEPVKIDVLDLPGIYSLSPYTPEEVVSRAYILDERPDAVINIVDATSLERGLYLTTQLLETDIPVVVALNMEDVLAKNGDTLDVGMLKKQLGVPVVSISALKGRGMRELMEETYSAVLSSENGKRKPVSVLFEGENADLFKKAAAIYEKNGANNAVFRALKAMEDDESERRALPQIFAEVKALKAGDISEKADLTAAGSSSDVSFKADEGTKQALSSISDKIKVLNGAHVPHEADGAAADVAADIADEPESIDYEAFIADARYRYITANLSPALKRKRDVWELDPSSKADKVLTHKIWSIPLFLLIMFGVFHLTFSENLFYLGALIPEGSFDNAIFGTDAINSPGVILANAMGALTDWLSGLIGGAMPEGTWYTGLVTDGVLGGLFAVLSFIPQIMCLFALLSILEDSGYMARAAFVMDRLFRRFGLSGRAFMPLLMCFGCSVPAIMASRTLQGEKERRITIFLAPFLSCGAKMPIWVTFGAILFAGRHADLVVYGVYLLGIAVAVLAAVILNRTAFKGEAPPFLMELPAYRMPHPRNLVRHVWDKLKHYVIKAGTVITAAIIVIWFISSFSFTFRMVEDPADSIIGIISRGLAWLFWPLGFGQGDDGWKFIVAVLTGLIAKEMVVATMGVYAGMSDDPLGLGTEELAVAPIAVLIAALSIPAAFAFMAFNLLSVPCMAAVAAANGELNSKKHTAGAIIFWIMTAYVVAAIIYLIGTYWWTSLIFAGIAAILVALSVLRQKGVINFKNRGLKPVFIQSEDRSAGENETDQNKNI
ncbi:MAG: ferrous iron transport protein B [Clostridiales bacterium]|jgi:ferrous iron transport protein B|nr:ferrous iron transport protein B [Clostridiales bacterium]